MKKTDILVVDAEEKLLLQMKEVLTQMSFSVKTCTHYADAIKILSSADCRLVIIDINLIEVDGLDLHQWIKENLPAIKVILVTGFLNQHDVHDALDSECFGFLVKPITKKELKKIVNHAVSTDLNLKITDEKFARIDIDDFICGNTLLFPIYIRPGDSKFLKVGHTGADIDIKRIQFLKEKGINELWIDIDDLEEYVSINEQLLMLKDKLNPDIKVKLLSHASELTYESMRLFEVDEETISSCMISIEKLILEIEKDQSVYERVQEIFTTSPRISKMAILGASFSILMGKVKGWKSSKNLNTIATGALFRDIFLIEKNFNYSALFSHKSSYDHDLYKSHPAEGAKLLSDYSFISKDVIKVIEQHHEDGTSQGYPKGLSAIDVYGLASMVNVVDYFLFKMFKFQALKSNENKSVHKYIEQALIARYGNSNENVFALLAILRKHVLIEAQYEYEAIKKRGFLTF